MRPHSMLLVAASATLLAVSAPLAPAAVNTRAVVGTAVSNGGNFQVAHTNASGTATVLSGDQVQTAEGTSRILLRGGSEIELMPNSAASVFGDHATLDSGILRTRFGAGYTIASRNFTVRPTDTKTVAILEASATSLTVSVPTGSADILSATGSKLVHMTPGNTLNFGAYESKIDANVNIARLLGTLDSENGHYLLRDRFSNTVSELVGPVDPKLLNHLVTVDGNVLTNQKPDVLQVDHLVQVSQIKRSDATYGLPCTPDGNGGIARIVHLDGALSKLRGHFLLADKSKGKSFELIGDVDDKEVGSEIAVKGFVLPKREALLPAEEVVYTEARKYIVAASPCAGLMIGGAIVSTGIITWPKNDAVGTALTNKIPISY